MGKLETLTSEKIDDDMILMIGRLVGDWCGVCIGE